MARTEGTCRCMETWRKSAEIGRVGDLIGGGVSRAGGHQGSTAGYPRLRFQWRRDGRAPIHSPASLRICQRPELQHLLAGAVVLDGPGFHATGEEADDLAIRVALVSEEFTDRCVRRTAHDAQRVLVKDRQFIGLHHR